MDAVRGCMNLFSTIFNLVDISGKYEVFNTWNAEFRKNFYPDFIKFVFSIPIFDKEPNYPQPSIDRLNESLSLILRIIEESGKKIPYAIIDMKDYGLMDGKTVFAKAMKLMSK